MFINVHQCSSSVSQNKYGPHWVKSPDRRFATAANVRREFRVFHWAPAAHCWLVALEARTLTFEPQKQLELPEIGNEEDIPLGNGHVLEFMWHVRLQGTHCNTLIPERFSFFDKFCNGLLRMERFWSFWLLSPRAQFLIEVCLDFIAWFDSRREYHRIKWRCLLNFVFLWFSFARHLSLA